MNINPALDTVFGTETNITPNLTPNLTVKQVENTNQTELTGRDIMFTDGNLSQIGLITLPANINLYYGSQTKNSFDPSDIKLSDGTLLALFSNNFKLSSDVFMNCSNYPASNGYLHQFITKKNIPFVQMVSVSTIGKNNSLLALDAQFCQKQENPKLNGFAYAIKNVSNQVSGYDYIIGLCNPNEFLAYKSTSICVNPYRLSDPMNIN